MEALIRQMLTFGFDADDLKHLERLSDPMVLHRLPIEHRNLKHNVKSDVVRYLNTWAEAIEETLFIETRVSLPCLMVVEL